MLTTLLASIAVAASLADGPAPPITVTLNSGGQYSRGEYAQAQFRASADGYVLLLQTDQNGRIRVLFPLDPGDDNFIRGGKTYKVVGRDNRGSFYLDEAGASGMVYAAWSKSPFQFAEFVRGDHWDYSIFDQYNAADDPESQLTDFVLNFTTQGFDYAIDRYIVYSYSEYSSGGSTTYIGVTGWPWPTYYTAGWGIGISFGWGYPGYGWGYPGYGWGYPGYGWGYPGYGWGYPGYGWGYPGYGWGYPGYGWGYPAHPVYPGGGYYPGYGGGYPGYRPYTFKPGGTITPAGNPYRPRGDTFAPRSSVFQTSYRDRPTYGLAGTGRLTTDAATISGRAEAGRRPAARPAAQPETSGQRGSTTGQSFGGASRGATGGTARRPSSGSGAGAAVGPSTGGARRSTTGTAGSSGATPRARSAPGASPNSARARGWTSDGQQRPAVTGRPRISPTAPSSGRSTAGSTGRSSIGSPGSQGSGGRAATPSRQPSSAGSGRPSAQPPSGSFGGSRPSAQPQSRPSSPPAARSGGGGGGGSRGGAPAGGGGGGRRGR